MTYLLSSVSVIENSIISLLRMVTVFVNSADLTPHCNIILTLTTWSWCRPHRLRTEFSTRPPLLQTLANKSVCVLQATHSSDQLAASWELPMIPLRCNNSLVTHRTQKGVYSFITKSIRRVRSRKEYRASMPATCDVRALCPST